MRAAKETKAKRRLRKLSNSKTGHEHVCVKCKACGLPRRGHFDRKTKAEKRSMLIETKPRYPVATFQLAAVIIQKTVRTYIVQIRRQRNEPTDKWQQRCVHYLSKKGPYGKNITELDPYRRIAIYASAASRIQFTWRKHRWLSHLQLLNYAIQNKNAVIIQRAWKTVVCRRFYRVIGVAIRSSSNADEPDKILSLVDPKVAHQNGTSREDLRDVLKFRLGGSSFPPTLFYKVIAANSKKANLVHAGLANSSRSDSDVSETVPEIEPLDMEWVDSPLGMALNPIHWRERRRRWNVVDSARITECFQQELKRLQETDRRRRTRRIAPSIRQKSTRDFASESRKDKIRKMSKRKWKWFYQERQPKEHENASQGFPHVNEEEQDDETHADLMEWLMNIDINEFAQTDMKSEN